MAGFYDFVPYRFGPYSFALRNDLRLLTRNGYAEEKDGLWELGFVQPDRDWIGELDSSIAKAIRLVLQKHGGLSRDALLRYVYRHYPWFASRTELKELLLEQIPSSAKAELSVYTVGYEKKTVDGFLANLINDGIEAIIDVRSNPVSRNYGFAGSTLKALAEKVKLHYYHLPELGIPSADRKGLDSPEKYETLFESYREKMLPKNADQVSRVVDLVRARPSALLCYEAAPERCHRGPLADRVAEMSRLPVVHLS